MSCEALSAQEWDHVWQAIVMTTWIGLVTIGVIWGTYQLTK